MMSDEMFSLLVWCWHDLRTDATQLRVVRVDTGEEVQFSDGKFLLRVSSGADPVILRCLIRHIASGREANIQSGEALRTFVNDCLLKQNKVLAEPGSQSEFEEGAGKSNVDETEASPEFPTSDTER